MSYIGNTDINGPWFQGLTSSSAALQGVWATDLISYDAASNYSATLKYGLRANWRINQTLENNGVGVMDLTSWRPSTSSPVDEYGQFHDYRTSGIPLGPETLIRTGENEAGLFFVNSYQNGSSSYSIRFGAYDRWTTSVELVP